MTTEEAIAEAIRCLDNRLQAAQSDKPPPGIVPVFPGTGALPSNPPAGFVGVVPGLGLVYADTHGVVRTANSNSPVAATPGGVGLPDDSNIISLNLAFSGAPIKPGIGPFIGVDVPIYVDQVTLLATLDNIGTACTLSVTLWHFSCNPFVSFAPTPIATLTISPGHIVIQPVSINLAPQDVYGVTINGTPVPDAIMALAWMRGTRKPFTASGIGPVLSSVTGTQTGTGQAGITWTSDPAAGSQVHYSASIGDLAILGDPTKDNPNAGKWTQADSTPTTNHSVTVAGLPIGTTYYRVYSVDRDGNTSMSDIQTVEIS